MSDQKQQTPQIGVKRDMIQSLYKSIDQNDKVKLSELRQMEQDQYQVQQMRDQREMMEVIKQEFERKDRIITDQQEQLVYLQEQNQGLQQLRAAFQELIQKSEDDVYILKKISMEKDNLQKELDRTREDSKAREEKVIFLKQDNDKLNNFSRETEVTLTKYKDLMSEKDDQHFEQIRNFQGQITFTKEENQQLKDEIQKLDETLFALDYVKEQNVKLQEEIKNMTTFNQTEKSKCDKFEKNLEDSKASNKQLRKQQIQSEQILIDFKQDHQIEIDNLLQQMKKLDLQVQDLKAKHKEDEKRMLRFKEEISHLQLENSKFRQFELDSQEVTVQLEQRARESDRAFNQMKQETHDLRIQLRKVHDREDQEKKINTEMDKVRQNLISVRNTEVEKMNQLFEGIISTSKIEHSSLSKKKNSTPTGKKLY